jgi:predicted metalloprotease with PDZ domain
MMAAAWIVIAGCLFVVGQTVPAAAGQTIAFTVSMPKPHTHMLEVNIDLKRSNAPVPAEDLFVMPVWTPGSYLVREFARHVQDFSVQDSSGKPLRWEKISKDSWRVTTNGAREYRVSYRVYANELTVRTSELNSDHAFWNNPALLMYLEGALNSPSTLQVLAPQPWKIATGLPAVPGQKNTFRADNFDILYDSPVEVSNFKTIAFEVKGVPHRIVIDGDGNYDPERLRTDVRKIVETQLAIMGGEIPYRDYTFILHLRSNTGGGLEHLNSTALGFPRFGFKPESHYQGFLRLVSHEFFHLWNVKRIRPDALGPFDYRKENYTKLLWVAEGVTSYYTDLALVRAKLISPKEFLAAIARNFENLQNVPGRLVMSAEEASFDTWIKYYRPDENFPNSQVDYYDKGSILGLLLDLQIRKSSEGRKSLDDVMRYLYTEFYKKNRNYTPEDFQRASELMAGVSLDQFFARYVRGREELNYNEALEAAGLALKITGAQDSKVEEKPYLGAELAQEGDRLMVRTVLAGGPAYEQGLNTGDQIVAFNNMRATKSFLEARLAEKRPGDPISLTIFRFDDLSTLLIKLGGRRDAAYTIVASPTATDLQKRIYESWLGEAWAK